MRQRLVDNVFVTGSMGKIPGFKQRVEAEIRENRPFKSKFSAKIARDPARDAFNGMRKFARNPDNRKCFFTKADFEEKGAEYLREHPLSNKYTPTPEAETEAE